MSWLPHCTGGIMVTKKKKTAIEALVLDKDAVQKLKGQTSLKHSIQGWTINRPTPVFHRRLHMFSVVSQSAQRVHSETVAHFAEGFQQSYQSVWHVWQHLPEGRIFYCYQLPEPSSRLFFSMAPRKPWSEIGGTLGRWRHICLGLPPHAVDIN